MAGGAVFALLAVIAAVDLVLFRSSQHGRARYDDIQVTLAPSVHLQSLPWSGRLPNAGADQFAVSPGGGLVVRIGGALYDFADGEKLLSGGENKIQSFALVDGALVVITANGRLGYVSDGSIDEVGEAPLQVSRMASSENSEQLFLYGGSSNYSLLALGADGVHPLARAPEMIEAVAGDSQRHAFSVGNSLFLQSGSEKPVMLLDFPDTTITGLALSGDVIFCATNKGIYQLQGALAIPLVLGMGGQLRLTPDGLLVLNPDNGRLYRLVFMSGRQ